MFDIGPPTDWGLPPKFSSWWEGQEAGAWSVCEAIADGHAGLAAPTGAGKTVMYMVQHELMPATRTVVLTATKALESQLLADCASMGMRVVHGRANYSCGIGGNCDQGRVRECRYQWRGECPYMLARQEFLTAPLGVTNYSYALMAAQYSPEGIGPCDLLILDEAHSAVREIGDALKITVPFRGPVSHKDADEPPGLDYWRGWASRKLPHLQREASKSTKMKSLRLEAERWVTKLLSLRTMGEDWIVDRNSDAWEFNPIWPAKLARSILYRFAKRVLFVSATLRPKTMELLGVTPNGSNFIEIPSVFDSERCLVHLISCEYVNHRMSSAQTAYWLSRIDQYIAPRVGRKGLIHSVSYARAKLIYSASDYKELMILDSPGSTARNIAALKASPTPRILVSPAIMAGYDFPMADAEWQAIVKAPYPDRRSHQELAKARRKQDPDYLSYEVIQTIVQAAGRIMRRDSDRGETAIFDNTIGRLIETKKELFPAFFLDRVRSSAVLPAPPPKL